MSFLFGMLILKVNIEKYFVYTAQKLSKACYYYLFPRIIIQNDGFKN